MLQSKLTHQTITLIKNENADPYERGDAIESIRRSEDAQQLHETIASLFNHEHIHLRDIAAKVLFWSWKMDKYLPHVIGLLETDQSKHVLDGIIHRLAGYYYETKRNKETLLTILGKLHAEFEDEQLAYKVLESIAIMQKPSRMEIFSYERIDWDAEIDWEAFKPYVPKDKIPQRTLTR